MKIDVAVFLMSMLQKRIAKIRRDCQIVWDIFRSTSESRPNSIEGKNVRPYVRPSTKSFFNLNEIWYIGRGR